jgi:hypothetical protein
VGDRAVPVPHPRPRELLQEASAVWSRLAPLAHQPCTRIPLALERSFRHPNLKERRPVVGTAKRRANLRGIVPHEPFTHLQAAPVLVVAGVVGPRSLSAMDAHPEPLVRRVLSALALALAPFPPDVTEPFQLPWRLQPLLLVLGAGAGLQRQILPVPRHFAVVTHPLAQRRELLLGWSFLGGLVGDRHRSVGLDRVVVCLGRRRRREANQRSGAQKKRAKNNTPQDLRHFGLTSLRYYKPNLQACGFHGNQFVSYPRH